MYHATKQKLHAKHYAYVTGPAKIAHICTQNFALFLNLHLQYLLKYKSYDNEIFMAYLQIIKKTEKAYRTWISLAQTKKSTIFWSCVICADMPGFRRPSHNYISKYVCICMFTVCIHALSMLMCSMVIVRFYFQCAKPCETVMKICPYFLDNNYRALTFLFPTVALFHSRMVLTQWVLIQFVNKNWHLIM